MKAALRLLVLALAAALFAWFVDEAGPGEILATFSKLGARSVLVILPYALVYACDTLGWHFAFAGTTRPRLRYWLEFKLRMAGEAVNNIVPSAMIGGEPVKVYLAGKHGVSTLAAAQSVVVAKTTMTLAQVVFIALGALAATHTLAAGSPAHRAMLITTALAAAVVVALFWLQRRGMFTGLLDLARACHVRVQALESRESHLRELDETIRTFYRDDRARFALSTGFHLVGWIVGFVEILLVSHLVGVPLHWTQAFAIEAFAAVAKGLGAFMPGSIGVQESGILLLFRLFGLPDALGVSYAILRRGRELVWVGLGGAFLFSEETSVRSLAEHVRAQESDG